MAVIVAKKHETKVPAKGIARFLNRIPVGSADECWLWDGVTVPDGYGYIKQHYINEEGKRKAYTVFAHRLAYYIHHGDIPDQMVVDHLCHDPQVCLDSSECQHRKCVNPNHLTVKGHFENTLRSNNVNSMTGWCKNRLHRWTDENVRIYKSGKRVCIPCKTEQAKRTQARRAS